MFTGSSKAIGGVLCTSAVFYSLAGSCFVKRVNAYMPTCLLLFLRRINDFMARGGWHLLSQDQGGFIIPLTAAAAMLAPDWSDVCI